MNVRPEVTRNPKVLELVDEIGLEVGWYLLCIWGHCQENQLGGNWGQVKDHYVERVCGWNGKRGELYKALAAGIPGRKGIIYRDEDGNLIINDWEHENAKLVQKWRANPNGKNQHTGKRSDGGRKEDGARSDGGRKEDGARSDGGRKEDGARSALGQYDMRGSDGIGDEGIGGDSKGEGADAPARPDAPPAVRLSWEECHGLWSKDPGCSEKMARAVWLSLEADKLPCGSWRKVRSGDRKDERVGDARTAFLSRLSAKMADAEERKKPEKKRAGQSWGREKLPPKIL